MKSHKIISRGILCIYECFALYLREQESKLETEILEQVKAEAIRIKCGLTAKPCFIRVRGSS